MKSIIPIAMLAAIVPSLCQAEDGILSRFGGSTRIISNFDNDKRGSQESVEIIIVQDGTPLRDTVNAAPTAITRSGGTINNAPAVSIRRRGNIVPAAGAGGINVKTGEYYPAVGSNQLLDTKTGRVFNFPE